VTKAELRKNIRALSGEKAKSIIEEISIDCIREGRKMMTSSEILDMICEVLRENKLDEP
jgi:hypothetical protein